MISLANISIQYGGRFLFDDISFTITEKDRIGLVGKNGAGKSTMLKVLVGEILAESGTISMDNGTTLGYLPQDKKVRNTKTVFEESATAFEEVQKVERQLKGYHKEIEQRTDYESEDYFKLLEDMTEAQDRLHRLGGLTIREDIEKILKGLGFQDGDFDRLMSEFSGGWQMRVELAKILLMRPDYVLLDEPTNHLDIESIMWLEDFLASYTGGVLLISHDRAFLDKVTNRTVELVNGKAYDYRTSYSAFMDLREQRIEKQKTEAQRQEKFIEHTETLINKFRAKKNKAKFAQSLIKKLDRIEIIEVDEKESASIKFRFPPAPRSGKIVVEAKSMTKRYDDHLVLNNVDFILERGEKIAFVGKNGEGKTTLAKIINRKLAYDGHCELGHNVSIGYYEQHQAETMDGDQTVLQVIDDAATGEMRHRVRSLLGAFLFSGEDVEKKVQVLSGGEKSRLALARLLLDPVNLLILDEPTNHLDMQAKEVLKKALQNFDGSLILVSHDRDFLQGLTDKVYEFRDKKIKPYIGDIYAFLEERKLQDLAELNLKQEIAKKEELSVNKQDRIALRDTIRELDKNIKRQSNSVSKSEKRILELEKEIASSELVMADPDFYNSHKDPNGFLQKYNQAKTNLKTEMSRWEELAFELEVMREERSEYE
ncbi:MAG: ATP-binding cassette domain-containing protein [Chitinophagales bacterium]